MSRRDRVKLAVDGPLPRADRMTGLFEPATVVLFAGLGGVCIGEERAYVRGGYRDKYIDLAVNHWETAIGVHELNHPMTQHLHSDVLEVDPNEVLKGRRIAKLHLSPDCTDFSKAKGSRPKRKHIRALAWVGVEWAKKRRPDVITLENVEEFKDWGPLTRKGQPCPARRGIYFQKWVRALERIGYVVECRELQAMNYGAPTTRKRLFVIARCDGRPIVWPAPTHGPAGSGLLPYRTAAECIDWSIPMLSVFATRAEAKAWAAAINHGKPKHERIGIPQRPLRPKTQDRLGRGLLKFVLESKRPFLVAVQNAGWDASGVRDVAGGMPTVTAQPKGGGFAVADAEVAAFTSVLNHAGGEHRASDPRDPMHTVCGANDARAVVAAELAAPYTIPNLGEREGQAPRCRSVELPAPAVTAKGNGARLVAAHVVKHYGGVVGTSAASPLDTVTATDHNAVAAVHLSQYHAAKGAEARGQSPDEPIRTLDTQPRFAPVAAHLVKFRGESPGTAGDAPLDTITAGSSHGRPAGAGHGMGVAAAFLSHFYTSNTCGGEGDPRNPAKTVTSGGQHAVVAAAFLAPYYGSGSGRTGRAADAPASTVTAKDRLCVVAVEGGGWPLTIHQLTRARRLARWARQKLGKTVEKHFLWVADPDTGRRFPLLRIAIEGEVCLLIDLAMRMLKPRELARAQGFPDSYVIDRTSDGRRISIADQVKLIGNSVPPQFAEAIAWENVVRLGVLDAAGEGVAA